MPTGLIFDKLHYSMELIDGITMKIESEGVNCISDSDERLSKMVVIRAIGISHSDD